MLDVYTTLRSPDSFGSAASLKRNTGRSWRETREFLSGEDCYTLHKARRIRFPRRKIISKGIGDLCQADLADLSNLSNYNDSNRYVLCVIDAFSKKAWARPLKNKMGSSVTRAFRQMLDEDGLRCGSLQTDKGTEFLNSTFQSLLSDRGIRFYTSQNEDIKAAIAERFIRSLKQKLFKYFTFKNTKRYVDVLQDALHSYNNSYHRSIRMRPSDVNAGNEDIVATRLYPPKPKTYKWKYDVGDKVRISMQRLPFRKSHLGQWSEEIFKISKRLPTSPVTYEVADLNDERIKGTFYQPELQKVQKSDDALFTIDKILKTRKRAGKIQYLVSWKGYPRTFDSWVDALVKKS